ncbi:PilZ domain-containing protein [Aquisalimonas lutea]|uniref:PilZ domain-containing protein n=1 Tax=Aquisalimonas lutea TaxID=1327750 RepID=UPI0025B4B2AF|nr:PilZ domain-containing protein [Aquisalimonas lutea]MDN3519315.1 PilZ domain-containing protein [Aquisalimonas lutea]
MAPGSQERRHFSRVPFDGPAQLSTPETTLDTQVIDLSLKGVMLIVPETVPLAADARYHLVITLAEEARIAMALELAHRNGRYAGFHCTEIDMESMGHLRRLVELNLGDPATLQRELGEMAEDLQSG